MAQSFNIQVVSGFHLMMTALPNGGDHAPFSVSGAADEVSVAHHGAIIETYSFGFINVFALYNAGGFAAGLSIIATEYGQRAYAGHPHLLPSALALFFAAFIASTALMVVVFVYSLGKYRTYRERLRGRPGVRTGGEPVHWQVCGYISLITILACTALATAFSLTIVFNTPPISH